MIRNLSMRLNMRSTMQKTALVSLLATQLTVQSAFGAKGPNNNSLRAMAMGNAFVAVADDRLATYYNPAGLNLINKLGNYEKRPDLGYYPENYFDARMGIGFIAPDFMNIGLNALKWYNDHSGTVSDLGGGKTEALSGDEGFYNDMLFIDRLPVNVGLRLDMELAVHNFGAAFWTEVVASPMIDAGVILPAAYIEEMEGVAVGQLAGAYELTPQWSIGAGYRLIKTEYIRSQEISINTLDEDAVKNIPEDLQDSLNDDMTRIKDDALEFDHAIDLGVMYQYSREVRFGAALQNIYMGKNVRDEVVTPELTFGVAWSPRKWQRNTTFFRKVNIAADFEDALNNDRNYKFFSHLNFGMEIEQVVAAIPGNFLWGNARFLTLRGGLGFKGGYWTMGGAIELLRVLHLELATWAEEDGYFTGQNPNRYFVLELGIGL